MRKKILLRIALLALLKAFFLVYFGYHNMYEEELTWELVCGGIGSIESRDIINVVLQIFPDFLFFFLCIGRIMSQLKENYVYFALRERKASVWLHKFSAAVLTEIGLYEALTVLFVLAVSLKEGWAPPGSRLIPMILCQVMILLVFALIGGILLWRYNEMVAVYINLLLQAFPLFLVGMLKDLNGPWELAVKYIPLNWCRFAYLTELDMQPYGMIFLTGILAAGLYGYLHRVFKKYEPI